jgi:DNA-binding GntR family transcriptional regulator
MSAICAIVEDLGRLRMPRPVGHAKQRLLDHLRRPLSAREIAERAGMDLTVVRVLLSQMRRDAQVDVAYRRIVVHEVSRGRKRHVVGYYVARQAC